MWGVNFLNIAYFFAYPYHFGSVDLSFLPPWFFFAFETFYILAMMAALLLLIMVVYAQIRLVQVEHSGFHALEEKDHALIERFHEEAEAHFTQMPPRNDRWDTILVLSESASPGDWRRAILEADIMLFDALGNAGYPGDTVGERLKHANPIQMTTVRLAWDAHMLRNKIAHSGESLSLEHRDVRTAINQYKSVFEELGAI